MKQAIRILMIEENKEDAAYVLTFLRKRSDMDFTSTLVCTEKEFESAFRQAEFDILLCNYPLPRLLSQEVIEIARIKRPDLAFIIISGALLEEEVIQVYVETGADNYVMKDNLVRLPSAVKKAVEAKKQQGYPVANYRIPLPPRVD